MPTGEKNRPPMNDRREGIIRDPVVYKGDEIVSYVKDVGNGDPSYDANVRQVVIMKQDGSEHVVPEVDIMKENTLPPEATHSLDRRPDQTLPAALSGEDDPGFQPDANRQARGKPVDKKVANQEAMRARQATQPRAPQFNTPPRPRTGPSGDSNR